MALTFGGGEREDQAQAQASNGMLTGMTAQEVLDILPGPGSYYYNLYKAENPALVAEAEAIRNEARAAAQRGESPSQPVGGGLTFGGASGMSPAYNPPPETSKRPVPVDFTATTEQQNFLSLLQDLGLGALASAFEGTTVADPANSMMSREYTPAIPQIPTMAPVDFSMTPTSYLNYQAPPLINNLAYNPFMGLYEMPREETPQTVTERTGLFNYIYGPQG